MAIVLTDDEFVTLDESSGLQNTGTAVGSEDNDADGEYTNTSDVVHTSQGGIDATIGVNNQMFDPGDGAYFFYVNNPDPDFLSGAPGGLTATEADDGDNILYTGGTLDVDKGAADRLPAAGSSANSRHPALDFG